MFRLSLQVFDFLMFTAVDWITPASKEETGRGLWLRCCNETKLLETSPHGTTTAEMQNILSGRTERHRALQSEDETRYSTGSEVYSDDQKLF
jgi:hypothetical protein